MHKKNYHMNQIDYYYGQITGLEKKIERIPRNAQLRTDHERDARRCALQRAIADFEKKIDKLVREWKEEDAIRKKRQEEWENRKPSAKAYQYTPPEHKRYMQYTKAAAMRPVSGGRCSPR